MNKNIILSHKNISNILIIISLNKFLFLNNRKEIIYIILKISMISLLFKYFFPFLIHIMKKLNNLDTFKINKYYFNKNFEQFFVHFFSGKTVTIIFITNLID